MFMTHIRPEKPQKSRLGLGCNVGLTKKKKTRKFPQMSFNMWLQAFLFGFFVVVAVAVLTFSIKNSDQAAKVLTFNSRLTGRT